MCTDFAAANQTSVEFLASCAASSSGMGPRVPSRARSRGASRPGCRLRATALRAAMDEYHRSLHYTCLCHRRSLGRPICVPDLQDKGQAPLITAAITRQLKWSRLASCCCLFATISCGSRSKGERWIIPENYKGWLRLDYAVKGALPLPLEKGKYLVRVPSSGRLKTSNAWNANINGDEFFAVTAHGLQKLELSPHRLAVEKPPIQEYAVQSVLSGFKFVSGVTQNPLTCVFVGTGPDFKADWGDCEDWQEGQFEPPKFSKHSVMPGPEVPAEK